jgi:hypothetical protein
VEKMRLIYFSKKNKNIHWIQTVLKEKMCWN